MNNQWAGAFGRPSGGAGVGTRVVTMALSTKQGAILHDRQADRVFTVREVARMHGFPDSFRFGVNEALCGGGGGGNASDDNVGGDRLGAGAGDALAAGACGVEEGAGAGSGAPARSRSRASSAQTAARRAPAAAAAAAGTEAAAEAATRGSAAAVARAITIAYHGIGNAVAPSRTIKDRGRWVHCAACGDFCEGAR